MIETFVFFYLAWYQFHFFSRIFGFLLTLQCSDFTSIHHFVYLLFFTKFQFKLIKQGNSRLGADPLVCLL